MEGSQQAGKDYLTLLHTHQTLTKAEEPISIFQVPVPFVTQHIFNIPINPIPFPSHVADIIGKHHENTEETQLTQEQLLQQDSFEIGEKESSSQVVKLGFKGMKSLVNMSSYFSNLITKKK